MNYIVVNKAYHIAINLSLSPSLSPRGNERPSIIFHLKLVSDDQLV
jgi:hypothetical protein